MKLKRKQWSKGIVFLLILAICFGMPILQLPAVEAQAASTADGLEYTVNDDQTVTITGYSGSATELQIPVEIDGCPVTCIGYDAFYGCSSLTRIEIPDSVTSIGRGAFSLCSNLTSIEIPDSVTNIVYDAFFGTAVDHVIFSGNQDAWNKLTADDDRDGSALFRDATVHYNTEENVFTPEPPVLPDCINNGYTSYKCSLCEKEYRDDFVPPTGHSFQNDICSKCGKSREDCIESAHPYENNADEIYTIYRPGASEIKVTFSSATKLANGDQIIIYDKENYEIGSYYGNELASRQIQVPGDTVKIKLVTDETGSAYGFAVSDIKVIMPDPSETTPSWTWSDYANGVSVTLPAGSFPAEETLRLAVTILGTKDCAAQYTAAKEALKGAGIDLVGQIITLYDIQLVKEDGTAITPTAEASITLVPLGSLGYMTPFKMSIVRMADVKSMETSINDFSLVYRSDKLGQFAVMEQMPGSSSVSGGTDPSETQDPTEPTPLDAFEVSVTSDQTASIDGYTGTETDIVIPDEINGYKTTSISGGAFKDSPVTSIVLPETVTKIGAGAFAGSSLKRITITANEIEIAEDAFDGCENIIICCYSASKAYAFAQEHGIVVELLDAKPAVVYGDLDGTGNVDANDALLILKIAAKLQTPTEEQNIAGDVDKSGSVDANDALDVLKKAAKLIDVFPVEGK